MKRPLTIAIVAVCFAAPLSYVTAGSYETGGSYASAGSRAPERSRPAEFIEHVNPYSAAPRIIHVPDAHERASLDSENWPAADDRADVRERDAPLRTAPVHRLHPVVKHATPHRTSEPKRTQHRRPYSTSARAVPPPAPVEHRAILSAPPPPIDGPTPIRPTPRFGAPVPTPHPAEQHAEAPAPAARSASGPQQTTAESAITPIPSNAPAEDQPAVPAEQ
jgi:hypothetical protein